MDGKSYRISFADMQKQTGCEREQRQVILKQEYQLSDYLNKRADSVTDHDSSSDSKSNSSSKNHYGSMIKKWRTTDPKIKKLVGYEKSLERVDEVMDPNDEYSIP